MPKAVRKQMLEALRKHSASNAEAMPSGRSRKHRKVETPLRPREARVLRAVLRLGTKSEKAGDIRVVLAVITAAARKGDREAQRWLEARVVEWQS